MHSNIALVLLEGMAVTIVCESCSAHPSFFKRRSCEWVLAMSSVITSSSCCFSDVSIRIGSPGMLSDLDWDDKWAVMDSKMNL